jgi:HEAT repeat protein
MKVGRFRTLAAVVVCSGLSGCAGFWDEVTSRDFNVKNMVNPPEPMEVLRTSHDGDARAKALTRLKEPQKNGGGRAEQDEAIKILTQAATVEPQPLCRMAAIRTLGTFEDPRATPILISAFDSADTLPPDSAFMVRCQTLTALGQTKQPQAAAFLAEVAKRPVKKDIADRDLSQKRDVQLAAVRALKNFPGSQEAAQVAQHLATSEKDVAVRDRAKEVYVAVTGHSADTMPPAPPTPSKPTDNNPIVTVSGTKKPGEN